jgi:hypothetical protein
LFTHALSRVASSIMVTAVVTVMPRCETSHTSGIQT